MSTNWIEVKVIQAPAGTGMVGQAVLVDGAGATLGRSPGNNLVLPDPDRYVSSSHAHIEFDGQRFLLFDDSTNGTFINGSAQPLGGVDPHILKSGDEVRCGEYLLVVQEDTATPSPAPKLNADPVAPFGPEPHAGEIDYDALDRWLEPDHKSPRKLESPAPLPGLSLEPMDVDGSDASSDPLKALDSELGGGPKATGPSFSDPLFDPPQPRRAQDAGEGALGSQSLRMPNVIPDEWDHSPVGRPQLNPTQPAATHGTEPEAGARTQTGTSVPSPSAPARTPIALSEAPGESESSTSRAAPVSDSSASAPPEAGDALAQALGLEHLPPAQLERLVPMVAEMMKETVQGLMQALRARQTIKNEFRINVTMVEPRENNPLKFSISAEDALENLFLKSSRAYLPPVEATREAFADIADHQLALFSALRTAYDNLMKCFDPERLEARFEKHRGKALLKGGRNWDAYKQFYQELGEDRDRTFRHLFAEEFSEAYERIFSQLKANRRKS